MCQVTSSTAAAGTTDYGYTLSGALASMTPPGGSAEAYTSDAYGDQITAPGGIGYAYDALGRLVTRTVGAGSASLSYLGISDTVVDDGSSDYSYTPSGDLTAEQASGGSAYATMSDLHGDVSAAFNPSSSSTTLGGSASYSPYGTPTKSGSSSNLGYQGDYVDPTTGLVEMGARWYNPSTGSFTSNDTIAGSPLSTTIDGNPYAYTSGNPLTETDPSGHYVEPYGSPATEVVVGTALAVGLLWDAGWWVGSQLFGSGSGSPGTYPDYPLFTSIEQWQAENSYALNSIGTAAGPAFAHLPGSSGGSGGGGGGGGGGAGGTVIITPVVYVPPPPPQDCYAGPAHTCTPPPAPESLLQQQHITTTFNLPSISELYKEGRDLGEGVRPPSSSHVSGAKASPNENGNPGNSSDSSLGQLLSPQLTNFQPQTPTAGAPPALPAAPQRLAITAAPPRLAITAGSAPAPATATGGAGAGQRGGGNGGTIGGECHPEDPDCNPAAEDNVPGTALERSPWPANRGFLGDPVDTTLEEGTRVDRYGGPGGTFVSPEGEPFEARSLRSTSINSPYNVYQVVKPITVQGGIAAPAFGYGGGAIQYEFPMPIQDLIDQGILKWIKP